MSILELFCSVDDFWQQFSPRWHHVLLSSRQRHRLRPTQLHPSEIMTIAILFHQSHERTFTPSQPHQLPGQPGRRLMAYGHQPKKPSLGLQLLTLPGAWLIPNSRYHR
jgi:hypothetical protein